MLESAQCLASLRCVRRPGRRTAVPVRDAESGETLQRGVVAGKKIRTIEGLAESHPVKQAWVAEQVPQCGYCQPGQIKQAVTLLKEHPKPTDSQIDTAMAGNLCRCGTYQRIRKAINRASAAGGKGKKS